MAWRGVSAAQQKGDGQSDGGMQEGPPLLVVRVQGDWEIPLGSN